RPALTASTSADAGRGTPALLPGRTGFTSECGEMEVRHWRRFAANELAGLPAGVRGRPDRARGLRRTAASDRRDDLPPARRRRRAVGLVRRARPRPDLDRRRLAARVPADRAAAQLARRRR